MKIAGLLGSCLSCLDTKFHQNILKLTEVVSSQTWHVLSTMCTELTSNNFEQNVLKFFFWLLFFTSNPSNNLNASKLIKNFWLNAILVSTKDYFQPRPKRQFFDQRWAWPMLPDLITQNQSRWLGAWPNIISYEQELICRWNLL